MSLVKQLAGEVEPCHAAHLCLNSPVNAESHSCDHCRFATAGGGVTNLWRPVNHGEKHPDLAAAKDEARRSRQRVATEKRTNRNRAKIAVQRLAERAERATERNIIHATANSGRVNRDGDHISAGRIVLDTKNQPSRLNPIVQVVELEKARQDARRAGYPIGGLVLRNQLGHGFVILAEEDYARLVAGLER